MSNMKESLCHLDVEELQCYINAYEDTRRRMKDVHEIYHEVDISGDELYNIIHNGTEYEHENIKQFILCCLYLDMVNYIDGKTYIEQHYKYYILYDYLVMSLLYKDKITLDNIVICQGYCRVRDVNKYRVFTKEVQYLIDTLIKYEKKIVRKINIKYKDFKDRGYDYNFDVSNHNIEMLLFIIYNLRYELNKSLIQYSSVNNLSFFIQFISNCIDTHINQDYDSDDYKSSKITDITSENRFCFSAYNFSYLDKFDEQCLPRIILFRKNDEWYIDDVDFYIKENNIDSHIVSETNIKTIKQIDKLIYLITYKDDRAEYITVNDYRYRCSQIDISFFEDKLNTIYKKLTTYHNHHKVHKYENEDKFCIYIIKGLVSDLISM